jgi:DNA-binding IclR family transcriptional regulator
MNKLGKRQKKILHVLISRDATLADISQETGIDRDIVNNILKEFYDAELVSKTPQGVFSVKNLENSRATLRAGASENDEWFDYKPVLKNLSRIL